MDRDCRDASKHVRRSRVKRQGAEQAQQSSLSDTPHYIPASHAHHDQNKLNPSSRYHGSSRVLSSPLHNATKPITISKRPTHHRPHNLVRRHRRHDHAPHNTHHDLIPRPVDNNPHIRTQSPTPSVSPALQPQRGPIHLESDSSSLPLCDIPRRLRAPIGIWRPGSKLYIPPCAAEPACHQRCVSLDAAPELYRAVSDISWVYGAVFEVGCCACVLD